MVPRRLDILPSHFAHDSIAERLLAPEYTGNGTTCLPAGTKHRAVAESSG